MMEENQTPATVPMALDQVIAPGGQFVLAELHAMKLDGVLVQIVGHAFRSAAVIESPALRATALAHHVPAVLATRAVMGQLSAAWVYGCAPPPEVVSLLQLHAGRNAGLPPFSGCTLRQVRLEDAEVQSVGGVLVTTPLRTALDVARTAPTPLARMVIEALSARPALHCSLGRIRLGLQAATHVPGKLRGQELLRSMMDGSAA